jgi:hypothetical protein
MPLQFAAPFDNSLNTFMPDQTTVHSPADQSCSPSVSKLNPLCVEGIVLIFWRSILWIKACYYALGCICKFEHFKKVLRYWPLQAKGLFKNVKYLLIFQQIFKKWVNLGFKWSNSKRATPEIWTFRNFDTFLSGF